MTYDPYYQQQPQYNPQPPKKSKVGRVLGFGCAGVLALALVGGCMAALSSSGSSDGGDKSASAGHPASRKTAPKTKSTPKKSKPKMAVFKVWGTAPAGVLGGLDITYGSDSDTRKGAFKNGTFEATLPASKNALYFQVYAQLQGSGDISCSVTVDGKTKKGHASGGYNICTTQLTAGLLGGWD